MTCLRLSVPAKLCLFSSCTLNCIRTLNGITCRARLAGSWQHRSTPPQRWGSHWVACGKCFHHTRGSSCGLIWPFVDCSWLISSSWQGSSSCLFLPHSSEMGKWIHNYNYKTEKKGRLRQISCHSNWSLLGRAKFASLSLSWVILLHSSNLQVLHMRIGQLWTELQRAATASGCVFPGG